MQWSYGTLGFIVCAELKIVPAKKYVKLEFIPFHNQAEYCRYAPSAQRGHPSVPLFLVHISCPFAQ